MMAKKKRITKDDNVLTDAQMARAFNFMKKKRKAKRKAVIDEMMKEMGKK